MTKKNPRTLEQRIAHLEQRLRDISDIRESARLGFRAYEILSIGPNFREQTARIAERKALAEVLSKHNFSIPKQLRSAKL